MTYLYAALGIAMITGISAMMQVANNISEFNLISVIKSDSYISSKLSKYDRRFLEIINDPKKPIKKLERFKASPKRRNNIKILSAMGSRISPIWDEALNFLANFPSK